MLLRLLHSKARAFVCLRQPSYFLFAWPKRKITKEKSHPAWRLPGILPGKSVSRGRAFRQGILPWRKGADIPVDSRYAACRPRLTAAQGPRVEQRAIVARTFQKSQSRAGATRRPPPFPFDFPSRSSSDSQSLQKSRPAVSHPCGDESECYCPEALCEPMKRRSCI
jgi:hypothetical protein